MTLYLTYPIPLANAKRQSTKRATRPLCALTAALAAMARGEQVSSNDPKFVADPVTALVAEFTRLGVPAERAALWAGSLNAQEYSHVSPYEVAGMSLSSYQKDAIASLAASGGILALDCGLGKTVTTTCAAIGYAKRGYNNRCYILAPVNAMGAWKEFREALEESFTEVAVLSIDSLHKAKGLGPEKGGVVIFDEVHLLGVETAKRTKLAHELRRCFDIGICLTGTLLTGGVEKALSALDLAIPGASLFSSSWTAGDYFECLVRKEVPGRGMVTSIEKPSGEHVDAFCGYLDRHTISMKKHQDVAKEAGIPPQDCEVVELGKPWKSIDDFVVQIARQYMEDNDGAIPQMQWCLSQMRREGLDTKLEWLYNWSLTSDEPAVLAAWSKETLGIMRNTDFLKDHVYVDGSVTGKDRQEAVRAFQAGEARYYIGQIDASAVSVNLFRASHSFTLELTNRAANYEQFLGRTCRRGQTRRCTHYDIITNPVQKRVLAALKRGVDFDAKFAEYVQMKETLHGL